MVNIGEMLDNKYRIIALLGRGAWGSVYLAENINLGNRWAIKEINLAKDCNVDLLAEPAILKKLNNPRLPRIVDILNNGEFLYIVEDYFEGVSLKELIQNRQSCTEAKALEWATQLCEILIYLHGMKPPLIYRDMKPGNIIIDGENQVKLIDFGIAREYKEGQDSDSTFIGTRGYAAPEQFAAGRQSDERTDIYGLGATLYHIVTGKGLNQPPYKMVPVRQISPGLSKELERIIGKCLEPNPDHRYESARELLSDLRQVSEKRWPLRRLFKGRVTEGKTLIIEKPLGTTVIAVGGTNRGVGCTHTVISMAAFLAQRKLKVAVCELNEEPVFYTLEEEGNHVGLLEGSIKYNSIDFYKKNTNVITVLKADYDYVLLDLGRLMWIGDREMVVKSPWFEEMNRADIAVLVSGAALWQLKDLAPYLKNEQAKGWQFVFTAPDRVIYNQIRREVGTETFATVYNPDPFHPGPELNNVYDKLLAAILPRTKKANGLMFWK